MSDLLLEIGTEEMPARFMPGIMDQMKEKATEKLTEDRLTFEKIIVMGTPRRLVLYVKGLSDRQSDLVKRVKGPAKKIAYAEDGSLTKAALGFARGQGIQPELLEVNDVDGVAYVFAPICKRGLITKDLLPAWLVEYIKSLQFPKNMLWGEGDISFLRPIRWLVSLLDESVIPISYAGISSDRISQGHRELSVGPVTINEAQSYVATLEKSYVLVDVDKRYRRILNDIETQAKTYDGYIHTDNALLEELVWLVEYPSAFCGRFNPDYLQLPREAIITPMKEHQRYFPVVDSHNKLKPLFVGLRNGLPTEMGMVIKGNEKVLLARFEDAKFFYKQDLASPFLHMGDKLDQIVFQEKLGTYQDKVVRIKKIAIFIAEELKLAPEDIGQCAQLCKNDLNSHMVREFPELQGVMGEYYALANKVDPTVAQGIREHYMPRFQNDEVPTTIPGMVVAIADKIDSIVGIMGVGLIPTGSQDPYALRRAAQGIVRIVMAHEIDLDMKRVIDFTYGLIFDDESIEEVQGIKEFMKMRLKHILQEQGIPRDYIEAVVDVAPMSFFSTILRAKAIQRFSKQSDFHRLLEGIKRATNLSSKTEGVSFDPSLISEPTEKRLNTSLLNVEGNIERLKKEEDFLNALKETLKVKKDLDYFLENTMVMVDDEEIRNNRLALLKRVASLTADIADMSQIVIKE